MNTLREALDEYLQLRRSLGFKLHDEGLQLPRFITFLEERDTPHITVVLAIEWAQYATSGQLAEWARRLGYIRGFARYLHADDIRTEIPPPGILPYKSKRAQPYLYSDDEIARLLDAALKLPTNRHSTPLRPWVFYCLFGLLSTTGMRYSEALNLLVTDVDLEQSVLTIRGAKKGQDRIVPLHQSTTDVLGEYLRKREAFFGPIVSAHVFVSGLGNRLDQGNVHRTFYKLSRQIGLRGEHSSHGPRIHDLRHRFAVRILTKWYQNGEDATRLLPVLSTYLGHVRVQDTYWYLSQWPELMSQAMTRLEDRWGDRV
ncbi:tyrosine-type recombinase/integrase [Rahnella sp. CG8]|uniref:tyrosine-type recombinase/integrase n=1 Tax=Rahnella sp. CG8 TaxID=2726078 RepID=UPI0020338B68|nr:tyrosine-type recombinase/integrase [Rahnella sp. CG8]MCM2446244.1 tyrosine-type recombinase/integrase [Rahnella sp. CG8]